MNPLKVVINPITQVETYAYSIMQEGKETYVSCRLPFIGCNMQRINLKEFSFESQDAILAHFKQQ